MRVVTEEGQVQNVRKVSKLYLALLSDSENVAENTVELLLCGRLEKVFQQVEKRRLDCLFFIRQRAPIFLHTVKIQEENA